MGVSFVVVSTCGATTSRPSCSTGSREQGREAQAEVEGPRAEVAEGGVAHEEDALAKPEAEAVG